jgi:putative peptide zinc metalloprotease protein
LAEQPADGSLPYWNGSLLDPRNIGADAERGDLLGQIVAADDTVRAIVVIDDQGIEFVQPGQSVKVALTQRLGTVARSTVEAVSQVRLNDVPKSISLEHGGPIATIPDETGRLQPRTPAYQVIVPLDVTFDSITTGATATARIRVGSRPLGLRLWRAICQTFRFEL